MTPTEALVYAKKEIDHATLVTEDADLYAPLFRNISVFKRYSYFLLNCAYLLMVLLLDSVVIASDGY